MEERAVVNFGLSLSEFWDSTPRELDLLTRKSAYRQELEMNQVRHIMTAVYNTVVDRKKKKNGYTVQEVMYLPLIDGEYKKEEKKIDVLEGQRKAEAQLAYIKERGWKPPKKNKT